MSKKAGKFAAVYKKTSQEFKDRGKNFDPMQPGWVQKETDFLSIRAGKGRVSYPHAEKKYTGKDTTTDGTAHITKKGKTIKK